MSDETKRLIERNFVVRGATRRGLAWTMACFIAAYFPQVMQVIARASTTVAGFVA